MKFSKLSTFVLVIFIIVIFTSFVSVLYSQNIPDSSMSQLNPHSWSIQFGISNNFNLRSFQGENISAKKQFSKKNALRFGISISGSLADSEGDDESIDVHQQNDSDKKAIGVDGSLYYLRYINPDDNIQFYFGAGPGVSYGIGRMNSESEIVRYDTLTMIRRSESDLNSWGINFSLISGVEWFFHKSVSLTAEYGSRILYDFRENKIENKEILPSGGEMLISKRKIDDKVLSFDALNILFGISIYF